MTGRGSYQSFFAHRIGRGIYCLAIVLGIDIGLHTLQSMTILQIIITPLECFLVIVPPFVLPHVFTQNFRCSGG